MWKIVYEDMIWDRGVSCAYGLTRARTALWDWKFNPGDEWAVIL